MHCHSKCFTENAVLCTCKKFKLGVQGSEGNSAINAGCATTQTAQHWLGSVHLLVSWGTAGWDQCLDVTSNSRGEVVAMVVVVQKNQGNNVKHERI